MGVVAVLKMLGGWLVMILVTSVTAETTVYGKLGGEVDLKPEGLSVTSNTDSITWKAGLNIALDWDKKSFEVYGPFKGRVNLNSSTGVMTIRGLFQNDSMVYTPEMGAKVGRGVKLIVISSVPVPTIGKSQPDPEKREFTLTCDGDTTGAEPVNYTWKADDNLLTEISTKHYIVTKLDIRNRGNILKEDSSNIREFGCEMKNPVSQRSSTPFPNPISNRNKPGSGPNIFTGVTVFVCLLAAVLLLAIFHRVKSGGWFYEKSFMPWDGEFWRKGDRERVDTTESNGTTNLQQQDEEAVTEK